MVGEISYDCDDHTIDSTDVPKVVLELAADTTPELVWANQAGGLTYGLGDRFIKWNPAGNGIDLDRERVRLDWISARHRAPQVIDSGADATAQWLVTTALDGTSAIGPTWRGRATEAAEAIATGLRAIHSIPPADVPTEWADQSWVGCTPPALGPRPDVDQLVVVHGDACAPNTLISAAGEWVGHVDFGDLCAGDRWADLAVASMSLDWNYGEGLQPVFFNAYGIAPDPIRIDYYCKLWDLES